MDFEVSEKIIRAHGLTGAAVYGVIYRECIRHYGVCQMQRAEIAKILGLRVSEVVTELAELKKSGLVVTSKKSPNWYAVRDVPLLHECDNGGNDE